MIVDVTVWPLVYSYDVEVVDVVPLKVELRPVTALIQISSGTDF